MTKYKLVYFNARGIAEPIRWIFSYCEVPFEDHRIRTEVWSEHVQGLSWGLLPILYVDGIAFTQSTAIARYLARKYKLDGKNEYEAYLCDQYLDHMFDWFNAFTPWYSTIDEIAREKQRRNILENVFPRFLGNFERIMKFREGKYLLGDSVSFADFYLANFLSIYEGEEFIGPTLLDEWPLLRKFKENVLAIPKVKEQIQKYPLATLCCEQCHKRLRTASISSENGNNGYGYTNGTATP